MNKRDLSKLQVRSEVLAVIQQLSALEESSRESQLKQIKRLATISNQDYVLDCLLRELPKANYDQRQIIAQLLLEFGSLEKLQNPLWNLIKDSNSTDELKDTANAILRNLGDSSDPDLYLSYLQDPQELLDKETERMLKLALKNPEAQIDFLDFLFSLPDSEQLNLISSLKNDYPSEFLTGIFLPTLEAKPSKEIYFLLIEALGNSRSEESMNILEKHFENSDCEIEKKKIKKSINLLKLAGIKPKSSTDFDFPDILKGSKIYKCFASPIDGIGNQGIIVSRMLLNGDISLFSVVINDNQGIVDCFGFNQITKKDFERIINKFQEGVSKKDIPPEYCKNRLINSEKLNRLLKIPIPYEYCAWKVLLIDIVEEFNNMNTLVNELKDDVLLKNINKIFDISDFNCWFIEDEDHPAILDFFKDNLSFFISYLNNDNSKAEEVCNHYDKKISEIACDIFNDTWKELYYERLINETYLLNNNDMFESAKLVATAAWSLKNTHHNNLNENKFIIKLLQKSVAESLLRFQFKIDDSVNVGKSIIAKDKVEKYKVLLDEMFIQWQIEY